MNKKGEKEMTVWVVMAEIDGATRLEGIYRNQADAEAKADRVEGFNFFFKEDGDEVWIEQRTVE